jgi:hypothetical protein
MLNRSNLSKADLISNLKNDLGEQTSYFDLMQRLLFQYSSNGGSYSYKINNFRQFWKARFHLDRRLSRKYMEISKGLDESLENSKSCSKHFKMFSGPIDVNRNE